MNRINNVILSGNLCKDPDLRMTPAGKAVASFRIAHNNSKRVGDEWQDDPCFVDCTVWDDLAERVAALTRGARVVVSGSMRQETWTSKESGKEQSKLALVIRDVVADFPKADDAGNLPQPKTSRPAAKTKQADDDEIPM